MISVIMLTYNREALVGRAIESLLAQTYRDFEFIIVDNGSTDRSGQIAEEHHADIAVCGSWREVNGVQQPKYVFDGIFSYSGEEAVAEMLKREKFNSGTPTKLIATEIFKNLRYDINAKYDDIGMTYKIFASASKAVVSGVPLYICTRHSQNNSTGTAENETIPSGQIEEYLTTFRKRTQYLTEKFPEKADFWLYTELSYALSMYDKTENRQLRGNLREILADNIQNLRNTKRFHSQRDINLLLKYEGEILS